MWYSSLRATGSFIVAYFVYPNGTALTSEQVVQMLSDGENYLTLHNLGLKNIVSMIEFLKLLHFYLVTLTSGFTFNHLSTVSVLFIVTTQRTGTFI